MPPGEPDQSHRAVELLGKRIADEETRLAELGEQQRQVEARSREAAIPTLEPAAPLPSPPPAGFEWIEAYRHWRRGFRMTNRE